MKKEEIAGLEKYLRRSLGATGLSLKAVPKKDDMLELHRGDEFLGLVYRLDEDGETSYELRMAILEMDLEG